MRVGERSASAPGRGGRRRRAMGACYNMWCAGRRVLIECWWLPVVLRLRLRCLLNAGAALPAGAD